MLVESHQHRYQNYKLSDPCRLCREPKQLGYLSQSDDYVQKHSLPLFLVEEIKRASKEKDVTQSNIVKEALELWLRKRLKKDVSDLSKIRFDDLPSEEEWESIQSPIK